MSKRVLFLCNTVYQCLVAVSLKWNSYMEDRVDIIISDHINNSFQLYERIKESGLFEQTFHIESYKLDRSIEKHRTHFLAKIYREMCPNVLLKNYINLADKYDDFFTANLCYTSELIFAKLSAENGDVQFHIYEDGYATYTEIFKEYLDYAKISKRKKIIRFFSRRKYQYNNIADMYLFEPELLCWDCKFTTIKMPKLDYKNDELKGIINKIFNYQENESYKKYIFLEESFFCENIEIDDVEIVKCISDIVGKENMFIKLHPRNRVDRFTPLGYTTNKDMGMAWEVITMNNDFSDTTFITISSGASLTPRILFGSKNKTIMLYKCTKVKSPYLKPSTERYFEKFKEAFGENLIILKDLDKLDSIL